MQQDQINDLHALILALEQERLSRPPAIERRKAAPSRLRWQKNNPTISFRTSIETKEYMVEWRDQRNISFETIMLVGMERLTQLELVRVLTGELVRKRRSAAHDHTKS